jgi:hypothetical protein
MWQGPSHRPYRGRGSDPGSWVTAAFSRKGLEVPSNKIYGRVKGGVTSHVRIAAQFPLPQPPQDPVARLSGHGHEEVTAPPSPCGKSTDVDIAFSRLGD